MKTCKNLTTTAKSYRNWTSSVTLWHLTSTSKSQKCPKTNARDRNRKKITKKMTTDRLAITLNIKQARNPNTLKLRLPIASTIPKAQNYLVRLHGKCKHLTKTREQKISHATLLTILHVLHHCMTSSQSYKTQTVMTKAGARFSSTTK